MTYRVKGWNKFQHFKDRRPLWIKLYRDILDDVEWHDLEPQAAKVLISCWLIASEYEGALPDMRTLAFRLRMSEKQVNSILSQLDHWLISDNDQDDINPISTGYQSDALEKRREETEKEKNNRSPTLTEFDRFWKAYPRKQNKGHAEKAWAKAIKLADPDQIISAVERSSWNEDKQFIPHPASWLNGKRWEDELPNMQPAQLTEDEWEEQERQRLAFLHELHRRTNNAEQN
jgi:hypothetical protein